MAISVNLALTIDDIGLASGRVFRVGDNAVVIRGNQIAAFDDDGVVFEMLEYEPAPSGFGAEVDPYFVHDNGDGTFNVYFRLSGGGLPLTHKDVYITLNAETGAKIGPTHDLPASQFGDLGAMGHTSGGKASGQMLQQAISLSDGTIAIVDTSTALNQAIFKIVNADGTSVAISTAFTPAITNHDSQLLFDLSEVGDKVAVVWANATQGTTGAPVKVQMFNRDGTTSGSEISLGNTSSTVNGVFPAAQAETLENGKLLVVWTEFSPTSGPDTDESSTWFSILNADGSVSVAATMVNTEITAAREDTPLVITTESGFVIGYSVLDFAGTQEGRLKEYANDGTLLDSKTGAYIWATDDIVRTDNNTAFVVGGNVYEITLPGADTPLDGGGGGGGKTLTGTAGADTLTGGAGDDKLIGKGGGDSLFGKGGNDEILGGKGKDTAHGNGGNDRIEGGDGNDKLFGEDGADKLFGGSGDDTLKGGKGKDILHGDKGKDTLEGGDGNDKLFGEDGKDKLFGGNGDDILKGGNGNDTLRGNKGKDRLEGGNNDDKLFGDSGNDKLFGNKGADILDGGKGADALTGGLGQDVFVFRSGYGKDRIKDFQDDIDTIQLDSGLWSGNLTKQQVIDQFATVVGSDILFDFGQDELTLQGFTDLTALKNDMDIL